MHPWGVEKGEHLRCDFTALRLTNKTNKWIMREGLESSLLGPESRSDTKDPWKELPSPASITPIRMWQEKPHACYMPTTEQHTVLWQQPPPSREKSVFSAVTVTDGFMRQLIAPFICVYSISSGKVRPALWTSGHLARDSLIYIPNGLFIGQQGTNQ